MPLVTRLCMGELKHKFVLLQDGAAAIIVNKKGQILMQSRADRDKWGLPGGCQELGESFKDTIIREVKEETNLDVFESDLELVDIVSGASRRNDYPNGDVVINNTALYCIRNYSGELKWDAESKDMKFFDLDNLPENQNDPDLIDIYRKTLKRWGKVKWNFLVKIGLDSEHDLGLNIEKVFKMLVVKELDKEFTPREYSTYEERRDNAFKTVSKVTEGLVKQQELMDLLEESYQKETKEAKFLNQISKLESDIQAKIYDLSGDFKLENALEDAKYYGEELSNEIIPQMKNASDGWILYDRKSYTDEIFKSLSEDIQNLEE